MKKTGPPLRLSRRFTQAVDFARKQHAKQTRKGSGIPYIYHLLGVSSLVLEHGGDEDQAIAALLHDVLEDCGSHHEATIRKRFGDPVADIVKDCTDGTAESKGKVERASRETKHKDWAERKRTYLKHLKSKETSAHSLLVSGCDKLHNARAIVSDLENPEVGVAVFERFTGGREGTLAYYHSVSQVFSQRKIRVAAALEATVGRMHELAGAKKRMQLK